MHSLMTNQWFLKMRIIKIKKIDIPGSSSLPLHLAHLSDVKCINILSCSQQPSIPDEKGLDPCSHIKAVNSSPCNPLAAFYYFSLVAHGAICLVARTLLAHKLLYLGMGGGEVREGGRAGRRGERGVGRRCLNHGWHQLRGRRRPRIVY